jgi:thymidylate kinase
MLITISGLDGAGKSTLIAWLGRELERRHQSIRVLHMNDDVGVYAWLRRLRDRIRRNGASRQRPPSPSAEENDTPLLRKIRNAVVWSKAIRRALYPIDLVIFLGYRLYFEKIRGCVLLMDRYFYDTLVDVADEGGWTWVRLLERVTPTPNVPVFLEVGPEEAYARKGEYSVDYLRRRAVAYRRVAPLVPAAIVIPNHDLDATRAAIEQAVLRRVTS